MPSRGAGSTPAVVITVLAAALSLAACTPVPSQPAGASPAAAGVSSTAHASVEPSEAAPGSRGIAPTFSPESIKVLAQETVNRGAGELVVLQVRAPRDSRFLIGRGSADLAAPCKNTIAKPEEVVYRVECPRQGSGQKLFSETAYGDFDFGFTKKLK